MCKRMVWLAASCRTKAEVIEAHHLMEPAGQLMEQRGQIAVRDDRFRDRQQGAVRVAGGGCLSVELSACHGEDPGQSLIRDHRAVRRIPGCSKSPA